MLCGKKRRKGFVQVLQKCHLPVCGGIFVVQYMYWKQLDNTASSLSLVMCSFLMKKYNYYTKRNVDQRTNLLILKISSIVKNFIEKH